MYGVGVMVVCCFGSSVIGVRSVSFVVFGWVMLFFVCSVRLLSWCRLVCVSWLCRCMVRC